MNHLMKRTLQGALLVSGLWVIGQGLASADTVSAPVNAPVIACGNSVGLFGSPSASCPSDAGSTGTTGASASDISAPITLPVTIAGNSIGIGQPTNPGSSTPAAPASGAAAANSSAGTVNAPVTAPVTACGNSVGVFSDPTASCPSTSTGTSAASGTATSGTGLLSLVDGGLLGNTELVQAPVTAPVMVCGNSVGVGADPASSCPVGTTGSATGTSGSTGPVASVPVTAPITVCGNGVRLFGSGDASCGGVDAATVTNPGTPAGPTTPATPSGPSGPSGPSSPNPVFGALSSGASALASTGAAIRSVLALAMILLIAGSALGLATRHLTGGMAS